MKLKEKQFWESGALNNANFRQYYNRLTELAISMFEWKNLPDTIDVRFLELTLFRDGAAVFFRDEALGELALQVSTGGGLNVYRVPVNRRAYAANGYKRSLNDKDSVIIWNNYLHKNSMLDVRMFSKRLWNLDSAIDVNANAQKTPIVICCDEQERITMLNLYKQYEGNEPFIFGSRNLNTAGVKALQTGAPYVASQLYELKTQIWNEALTYLGISNISFQKKERLISDEVHRSHGGTIASRYSRLESRREACRAINKMFGLNIWCDYREDYQVYETETDTDNDGEGAE